MGGVAEACGGGTGVGWGERVGDGKLGGVAEGTAGGGTEEDSVGA